MTEIFDRGEERRLLADWFDTVAFDREPSGLPPLRTEPDDE